MSRRDRLCILGATGSIGTSTLDVVARHPDRYEVVALTAHSQVDELAALCHRWQPRYAAMSGAKEAAALRGLLAQAGLATQVLEGVSGLCELAQHVDIDSVMAAIVGAAGLTPCIAAARAGKRLLLANKEALVVGGASFIAAVQEGGALLLPIDSEHSAIFQCLPQDRAAWPGWIEKIVLTASGGPFRQRDPATLAQVTPDEACAHPNWRMGRKISVDSATMMNKALEVIEAHWLFNLPPDRIDVVIHPQSIVHSMVVCRDASVLAQLGTPDMRVPIAYGLSFPERTESGAARLDLAKAGTLTFEAPDPRRFPSLFLAWDALRAPEGTAAVLNAANEVAVDAFLHGRLSFDAIHAVNAATMQAVQPGLPQQASADELIALDGRARRHAAAEVQRREK